jgi:DNA-binding NarL/FixJ family response regulator
MVERIRVIIADDHPLYREGVRGSLLALAGCEVVAECANADDAVKAVREHLPDIILLDISMPGGGIDAARRIAAIRPAVRIVMLTSSEKESDVMDALDVGARGYIVKGIGGEELATVIKSVQEGGLYVSPGLATQMLIDNKDNIKAEKPDLFSLLTEREEQILMQVAQGKNNKEIALSLALSENNVKRYLSNIMRKLGVRNRVEAALIASDYYATG